MLLPVRLETRYSDDGGRCGYASTRTRFTSTGWTRGSPPPRAQAGQAYWTALWTGASTEEAAWTVLVRLVHRDRAGWVAAATTPTNLADRPDPAGPTPAPVFPLVADRPRRAPVARALPDRFVVVVQQGTQSGTAVGSAIPPEVVVSLPRDDDPTTLATLNGATLGPGMEWLADYDEAKKIGLGIDVALPVPGAAVDLLLAFGVRSTLDPAAVVVGTRAAAAGAPVQRWCRRAGPGFPDQQHRDRPFGLEQAGRPLAASDQVGRDGTGARRRRRPDRQRPRHRPKHARRHRRRWP